MTPTAYVTGKLTAVLAFPLRQMLIASPALMLFVVYGVLTPLQMLLTIALLVTSFVAAGALGFVASTSNATSHLAQGKALGVAATLLVLPLVPSGSGLLLFLGTVLLFSSRLPREWSLLGVLGLLTSCLVGGAMVSPLASVLALCGSSVGTGSIIWSIGGASGGLLWSTLSMALFGSLFYRAALSALEQGGSVRT